MWAIWVGFAHRIEANLRVSEDRKSRGGNSYMFPDFLSPKVECLWLDVASNGCSVTGSSGPWLHGCCTACLRFCTKQQIMDSDWVSLSSMLEIFHLPLEIYLLSFPLLFCHGSWPRWQMSWFSFALCFRLGSELRGREEQKGKVIMPFLQGCCKLILSGPEVTAPAGDLL